MLPRRVRVDVGVISMKGYSTFPKPPASLEPHHPMLLCHIQDSRWAGRLTLCRGSVSVFEPTKQYTDLNVKTLLLQIIQFNISTQFRR